MYMKNNSFETNSFDHNVKLKALLNTDRSERLIFNDDKSKFYQSQVLLQKCCFLYLQEDLTLRLRFLKWSLPLTKTEVYGAARCFP